MKRVRSVATGLAAAIAIGLVAVAAAQPYGGPGYGMGYGMGMGMGPGPGMGMGPGMGPRHGALSATDVAALADARLADIKARLGINANQESAWQTYATQFKQQAQQMQAWHAQMWNSSATTSAPDRANQHAQAMQQRAAGMTAMSKALSDLYAVLTPEQKAVADQLFARGGFRGRPGWRG